MVIGLVVLVLIVIGLFTYRSRKADATANAKADQLIAALEEQGLRTPTKDQIVTVLGDDGGPLCQDPANALRRAIVFGMLTNGAGGPGQRPVIADNNVLKGQQLAIGVYCPEKLQRFQKFVNDLKLDNTAGG
jgi:ATP-dependent exoDNAse (exonuclease V) alpha subunit